MRFFVVKMGVNLIFQFKLFPPQKKNIDNFFLYSSRTTIFQSNNFIQRHKKSEVFCQLRGTMELNRTKVNLKQNNGGECLSFYSQKILQFLKNKSVELIDRIGLKRILFPVMLQYFR